MQIANKKDIPEELIVEIEKLSNLGYGIARVDGYVIFVENACPGDKVKIRVGKKNKNFANAKVPKTLWLSTDADMIRSTHSSMIAVKSQRTKHRTSERRIWNQSTNGTATRMI